MTIQKLKFLNSEYTAEDVNKMKTPDLLELRNLIADNLGATKIRSFKSHNAAATGVWQALQEYNRSMDDPDYKPVLAGPTGETRGATKDRGGGSPKCDAAEIVKRPTPRMFHRVKKIGTPDKSQRPEVWDRYKDGMRIIDAVETDGIHAGKIQWWVKQGLMKLEDPGDKIIENEMRAWYKAQGRDYPGDAKAKAAEEREKAKAEREAKRAAAAEEREKKAAEKKAAAEKKKAEAAAKKAEADAKKKAEAEAAKAALGGNSPTKGKGKGKKAAAAAAS